MRTFLRSKIMELTGVKPVIWANQNAPRPKPPLITLQVIDQTDEAQEETRQGTQDDIKNVIVPVRAVVGVQLYGVVDGFQPIDVLVNLVRWLHAPTVVDSFASHGMAVFEVEQVTDLTGLLNDKQTYEPRAAVDLGIRYMHYVEDKDIIETVHVLSVDDNRDILIHGNALDGVTD